MQIRTHSLVELQNPNEYRIGFLFVPPCWLNQVSHTCRHLFLANLAFTTILLKVRTTVAVLFGKSTLNAQYSAILSFKVVMLHHSCQTSCDVDSARAKATFSIQPAWLVVTKSLLAATRHAKQVWSEVFRKDARIKILSFIGQKDNFTLYSWRIANLPLWHFGGKDFCYIVLRSRGSNMLFPHCFKALLTSNFMMLAICF